MANLLKWVGTHDVKSWKDEHIAAQRKIDLEAEYGWETQYWHGCGWTSDINDKSVKFYRTEQDVVDDISYASPYARGWMAIVAPAKYWKVPGWRFQ